MKLELPGLGDQVVREAMVRFLRRLPEPCLAIETASRGEILLRPEHDLAVADLPREAHALGDQGATDSQATGPQNEVQRADAEIMENYQRLSRRRLEALAVARTMNVTEVDASAVEAFEPEELQHA